MALQQRLLICVALAMGVLGEPVADKNVCAVELRVGFARPDSSTDPRPSPRPECDSWDGKCGAQTLDQKTCENLKGCERTQGKIASAAWSLPGDVCTITCTPIDAKAESDAVKFERTVKQEGEADRVHLPIAERESLVVLTADPDFKPLMRKAFESITSKANMAGAVKWDVLEAQPIAWRDFAKWGLHHSRGVGLTAAGVFCRMESTKQEDCAQMSKELQGKQGDVNQRLHDELASSLKAKGISPSSIQVHIGEQFVRDFELFDGIETRVDTLSVGHQPDHPNVAWAIPVALGCIAMIAGFLVLILANRKKKEQKRREFEMNQTPIASESASTSM